MAAGRSARSPSAGATTCAGRRPSARPDDLLAAGGGRPGPAAPGHLRPPGLTVDSGAGRRHCRRASRPRGWEACVMSPVRVVGPLLAAALGLVLSTGTAAA